MIFCDSLVVAHGDNLVMLLFEHLQLAAKIVPSLSWKITPPFRGKTLCVSGWAGAARALWQLQSLELAEKFLKHRRVQLWGATEIITLTLLSGIRMN